MKIAYPSNAVVPSRSASTVQVMKTCEAFARRGHDVTLLVPDRPDLEVDDADVFGYYGVDPCFDVRKLSRPPLSSLGTFLVNARAGREAARLDPDLVYGRSVVGCCFAALHGVPTAFESHAPVAESRFGRVEDFFFRRLGHSSRFQRLVVVSEALGEYYRQRYPHVGDDVVVARNGADVVDESTEPAALDGREDTVDVGYVGHLYRGRGMGLIADLAERTSGMDFHVVGGDPDDVARWRDELGDAGNITFYGFVPPRELSRYTLAFDVQVVPYQRTIRTGAGHNPVAWMCPMKLFEYMAAGRAIVASDLPAIREILVEGETALFCDPEDADEWAATLERLADDAGLRARLGSRARSVFSNTYTWDHRARRALGERTAAAGATPARGLEPDA